MRKIFFQEATMAIVSYHRSIRSFHGAVGRMVFYEREGQTLLRCKGERTRPRSAAQKVLQEAFREASALWMELPVEARESWRPCGRAQGMTGYNAFLRLNIPRLRRGEGATTVAATMVPVITVAAIPAAAVPADRKPLPAGIRTAPDSADDGCRRFMESVRALVRRVSEECSGRAERVAG
ncbi:MAG: hypothetical protein JXA20_11985 [Spirochaetes bacterium]|nr:hypothetical protein [Spirochaetota bacterium]